MEPRDYREGDPIPVQALHPTRDLIVGAVVGAAALWLVPKVLDYLAGDWLASQDSDELELEET